MTKGAKTPLTTAERQARYKAAQEEAGRVRRNIWATPAEFEAINRLLDDLRELDDSEATE